MTLGEKACSFCGETIKAVALKCKHCGEFLNAAAVPVAVAPPPFPLPETATPVVLEAGQVLDLLSHLVDRSLVLYEEDQAGQGRYCLLETVRQYGRERLAESGLGEALRGRHRDHFLALAEEAKPKLKGPEQAQWLNTLESEHENLRAALEWCLGDEEGARRNGVSSAAAGLRLAGALSLFWGTRGHFSEGRAWYAAALSQPAAQGRTKARADALQGAGTLTIYQGDTASARALLEEALALRRDLGDKQGIAIALNNLGNLANEQGDTVSARALLEESLAIKRDFGDKYGIAGSLMNLGNLANAQGDFALGRALLEESLAIVREVGDKRGMAFSLVNLGPLACQERDYAASRSCLAECLRLCRALGEKHITSFALEGCAGLAQAQEQPERAVRLYGASNALRAVIGAPLPANEREEVERDLAALRAILGAEAFNSAWSAGRALTWEQAVAYALEEAEPEP